MISVLSTPPVFASCAALLGLCVGSFLNVVIHRLPKMMERQWKAECAEVAGQEAAPWAHRPACEGVSGAGIGKRCTHLGDAKDQAEKNSPALFSPVFSVSRSMTSAFIEFGIA